MKVLKKILFILFLGINPFVYAQPVYEAKILEYTSAKVAGLGTFYRFPENKEKGIFYSYFAFVPQEISKKKKQYILFEATPDTVKKDAHVSLPERTLEEKVLRDIIERAKIWKLEGFNVILLMPVITRVYFGDKMLGSQDVSVLNKDPRTYLQFPIIAGDLAQRLKLLQGISVYDKMLITGFGVSGAVCQRFVLLMPSAVKAAACGGFAGLPALPLEKYKNTPLPYPLGTDAFAELTGFTFDLAGYKKVPQFLYNGSSDSDDENDLLDTYSDEEKKLIAGLFGKDFSLRWQQSRKIIKTTGANIQTHTYTGTPHIPVYSDAAKFFKANMQGKFKTVKADK